MNICILKRIFLSEQRTLIRLSSQKRISHNKIIWDPVLDILGESRIPLLTQKIHFFQKIHLFGIS